MTMLHIRRDMWVDWIIIIIIIIPKTMFMVLSSRQSHCESSPGSFDECRKAPSGGRPKTRPGDLGCESACTGCQNLHPPSPFIITQPESWYSFYRPTEVRRLSRPSWLVTYRDGLPLHRRSPILVLTGSDVAQLRWSRPTRYHSAKPPNFSLNVLILLLSVTQVIDRFARLGERESRFLMAHQHKTGHSVPFEVKIKANGIIR